jgi:hypothetical protein
MRRLSGEAELGLIGEEYVSGIDVVGDCGKRGEVRNGIKEDGTNRGGPERRRGTRRRPMLKLITIAMMKL